MDVDKLLEKFYTRLGKLFMGSEYQNLGSNFWKPYQRLAELTRYINYNCNFSTTGVCNPTGRERNGSNPRNCCSSCQTAIGYMYRIPDPQDLAHIAPLFDEELGFWRIGTGCILPRRYRSPTCLCFHCGSLDVPERKLIDALRYYSRDFKEECETRRKARYLVLKAALERMHEDRQKGG